MANGPNDYRDPRVTDTDRGSSKKWLWYLIGAIVLLLLLAWLFGWFGGDEAIVTDETVIVDPAADEVLEDGVVEEEIIE